MPSPNKTQIIPTPRVNPHSSGHSRLPPHFPSSHLRLCLIKSRKDKSKHGGGPGDAVGRAASKGQKRAGPAMDAPGLTVGDGVEPAQAKSLGLRRTEETSGHSRLRTNGYEQRGGAAGRATGAEARVLHRPLSQPVARPLQGKALASLWAPPSLTWNQGASQPLAAAALSRPPCRGTMLFTGTQCPCTHLKCLET